MKYKNLDYICMVMKCERIDRVDADVIEIKCQTVLKAHEPSTRSILLYFLTMHI